MSFTRFLIYYFAFVLIFALNGHTQPQKCISPLAAVKYPGQLKHIPLDYNIKVFYETFGNAKSLITDQFSAGRKRIGVNGLWEDNHTFTDKHISKIEKIGKELQRILTRFPDREIKFRPFTEHTIAKPDKYLDIAQKACPSCIIVNSAWTGGFTENPKYQNEVHGKKDYPRALLLKGVKYNYDFDGNSSFDSDRKSLGETHKDAEEFCEWTWDLNQKMSEKDKTLRPQRKHKPNKKVFEALKFVHEQPKGTHNNLPKGWIYKSHADRHAPNKEDARAGTPVFIAGKGKQIVLKAGGKKIVTFNNSGLFDGGPLYTYRPVSFKKWGFNYARQAIKQTGSAVCDVFLDGKKVGKVNPGFRDGSYR